MKKDLAFYKFLAMLGVTVYIYKVMQENGGTLSGNGNKLYLDSDRLVDHAMLHVPVNDDLRPFVSNGAKKIAKKFIHNKRG